MVSVHCSVRHAVGPGSSGEFVDGASWGGKHDGGPLVSSGCYGGVFEK